MAAWKGIANGDGYTIEEKAAARRDEDLPEANEKDLWTKLPAEASFLKDLWRQGLIDLVTNEDGQGALEEYTYEQRAYWIAQGEVK
jgi:hypothetical protein